MRYHKQNELDAVKRLPCKNYPENTDLASQQKEAEKQTVQNLSALIELYQEYGRKVLQE